MFNNNNNDEDKDDEGNGRPQNGFAVNASSQSNGANQMSADLKPLVEKFRRLITPLYIVAADTSTLIIVGTNHAIPQCQEDVATVIQQTKPKTVILELCASRVCGCTTHRSSIFQTRPEFSAAYLRKAMKEIGTIPGMIFFSDVYKERQIAEQIHLDYGGEMIRAIFEARAIGSDIILGDRPIEITLKRQANALSYWKKIELMVHVNLAMKLRSWKDWFLLKASRIVFQDEKAFQVLVMERDLFLTYVLQTALLKKPAASDTLSTNTNNKPYVVAVVGQGHLNGIMNYFGKVTPQIMTSISSSTVSNTAD